jgi:D-beta-D-heptose 7-phosphate kinase/D-beta-D-heptose 1-phosphate adenosyltransferase
MRTYRDKIKSREDAEKICKTLRAEGKTIAFTNGAFDILHLGHIDYLTWARQQGDLLVVGLNSDASVRRYKSPDRPIVPQEERASVLAALECVDYVVIFDEDEPRDLIAQLLPNVLVKGEDWAHYVSGRDVVEANGGRVALAKLVEGRSTTNIIEKILQVYAK